MLKQFSFGLAVVIVATGIVFIGLNVLDIGEDFRLHLPISILNAILISAIAVLVAYFAASTFAVTSSPGLLGLGSGALAFGAGSLLRIWLVDVDLDAFINAHDSAALIASALHLAGAAVCMVKLRQIEAKPGRKQRVLLLCLCYTVAIASIVLVTWLALQGTISLLTMPGENSMLRDVIGGITAILFVASSLINLRLYAKLRGNFYYWYSLGLMLFASGVVFISQGDIQSPIAWLGRLSQYIGGLYFLSAILGAYWLTRTRNRDYTQMDEYSSPRIQP